MLSCQDTCVCYIGAERKRLATCSYGYGSLASLTPPPPHFFFLPADTHNHTDKGDGLKTPPGDVLLHAGDFTNVGLPKDVKKFVSFFTAQPHPHKVGAPPISWGDRGGRDGGHSLTRTR